MVARSSGEMERARGSISAPSVAGLGCVILSHRDALVRERGEISGEFEGIHDDDLLDLRLAEGSKESCAIAVGRDEDGAATGIVQGEGSLFGGERGVERNGDRASSSRMATSAIGHSGRFSLRMATRSPGLNAPGVQSMSGAGDVLSEIRERKSAAIVPFSRYSMMRSRLRSSGGRRYRSEWRCSWRQLLGRAR